MTSLRRGEAPKATAGAFDTQSADAVFERLLATIQGMNMAFILTSALIRWKA